MGLWPVRHRWLAVLLGSSAVLIVTGTLPPAAAPALAAVNGSECSAAYYHGDWRLGPERLPDEGVVADLVFGYHRFGGLTASEFLHRYWSQAKQDWVRPPQDGYVIDAAGHANAFRMWTVPGRWMDRFGRETGTFLSPYGQPFAIRALPPANLDGTNCNYHVYQVLKRFLVEAGPVARWYRQPGFGFQYVLNPALIHGAPASMDVRWLVTHGYLRRLR